MTFADFLSTASTYVPQIIAAASAAAATFPQGDPNSTWGKIRAIIDALAFNFANAENKPKVKQP
jgi:hypothetical protein